jgi:hypothetical protein
MEDRARFKQAMERPLPVSQRRDAAADGGASAGGSAHGARDTAA